MQHTAAAAIGLLGCAIAAAAIGTIHGPNPPRLEFLGEASVPGGTTFGGTVVGGLSSITYDAASDVFFALSDDQGAVNPARFYTLRIDLSDGHLDDGDVLVTDVTTLLAPDGQPYPTADLDPEGLTLTGNGELIVTSEGFANRGVAPWVRRYLPDGTYLGELPVPGAFSPVVPTHGVRGNLGFEAAAIAPDGQHLFVGAEAALAQDGPAATIANGSASRILRYNLRSQRIDAQYVYLDEPVAEPSVPPTAFSVNGLVELLPFDTRFMLAMERSFSVGAPGSGFSIRLYTVEFPGADNVNGLDSLSGLLEQIRPVEKQLLLDHRTLGLPIDNLEGMVLGPRLPDGRRSLLLVSDNDFVPTRDTRFMLFAID